MFKEYLKKAREKKERYKELEDDYNAHKKLEERHKSSAERELEKFKKEAREKRIENELKRYRKTQSSKMWGSEASLTKNNTKMYRGENMFTKHKKLF